ncbi:UNVERIFIED_ORG: hypothetical protein M2438_005305 [Methylobacterium sp. SuP10 SLI 274]|nr:hypothetical protein [Methylorubrum extorquens]MDF9789393.1 hypothetical protein [Methylorubrum extorquens]MDF9861109.1 hypothetical protein [Methylorubrum pseudosasae]MDH6640059.1 hypothetical protein [Methylobacterium sp. SuP10 SLI 274]MDH6669183.1 hypothetical protein [Methylorubrum zatmanii]
MTICLFFCPASVQYLEPETYAKLRDVAETGPGRPGGAAY